MPKCDNEERIAEVIADRKDNGDELVRQPDAFFFPRALWVSGPMHICWNAFESACKTSPHWEQTQEVLAAILSFLCHRGLRERFVQVCLHGEPAAVKDEFKYWRHRKSDTHRIHFSSICNFQFEFLICASGDLGKLYKH